MSPQPGYLFLKNRRDTRLPAAPSLTHYYTSFQILVNPPSRHCEERSDAAIRTPPSQSAPLPAPPQGEPRPGPRTPTPLASPLGGGAPAGGGEGPPPSCHCEERSDAAIRTPPALSVSSAASSPTGGAKTRPENPTDPCLPPWGRCPRRGRRGPASPVLSLRGAQRRGNPSPVSCQILHNML